MSVPLQQKMILPELVLPEGREDITCVRRSQLMFDGCGAHTTLGYIPSKYGQIFRKSFDAAVALLPEGSHFVSGAKVNHTVLPTKSIERAHSYMIDLNSKFTPREVCFQQWVGEFYSSFELGEFIEHVWNKTRDKLMRW